MMAEKAKALSAEEYERMAGEFEAMARAIRDRPEINHQFAGRLERLARQMREDQARIFPPAK
jgi:truncated hemoglobin YjbI